MAALPIRKKVTAALDNLSDEQVIFIWEYIESVNKKDEVKPGLTEADDEDDALVGFFSAGSDFAESSEEIFRQEYGLKKAGNFKDE